MSENGEVILKEKFQKIIKNDFFYLSEVVGTNLINGNKVIIDFMLYPQPHLIEEGFDPLWFGVEIKHFGIPGETGKMSRLIWQCITYAQSEFKIEKEIIRPAFILEYSDVEEMNNEKDREYLSQWIGMLRLGGLAHVGSFTEIRSTRINPSGGWAIIFSSSKYFYQSNGKYHKLKNYNVFKDNTGNCAT